MPAGSVEDRGAGRGTRNRLALPCTADEAVDAAGDDLLGGLLPQLGPAGRAYDPEGLQVVVRVGTGSRLVLVLESVGNRVP
jgi:hypothetical protein